MNQSLEGFLACFVSSCFFGSMFVPLRKYNCGDGFFVQWVMCSTIFLTGMIVNVGENFPTFHPFAMVGGVLWTIGNATALPIISMIGMGPAMLMWGVTNCVVGWATSRFGLFGLKKEVPSNMILNYVGLGCVVIGGVLFSFIKSEPKNIGSLQNEDDMRQLVDVTEADESVSAASVSGRQSRTKVTVGIIMSLCAGILYGCTFVPVIYIQQHTEKFKDASPNGISYVFSVYCGIFSTSTILFLIYTLLKGNKPFINQESVQAAAAVGFLWSIAQISWFIANDRLSQAISFPIISMLPGVCGALWSIFYFHEINDRKSLILLTVAIVVTLVGTVSVGVSKGL